MGQLAHSSTEGIIHHLIYMGTVYSLERREKKLESCQGHYAVGWKETQEGEKVQQ